MSFSAQDNHSGLKMSENVIINLHDVFDFQFTGNLLSYCPCHCPGPHSEGNFATSQSNVCEMNVNNILTRCLWKFHKLAIDVWQVV